MQRPLPSELLQTFLLIARNGSFTETADLVGRSQSAVSAQIQRLENRMGGPLLERSRHGVRPTARGARLLDYAERLLALDEACRRELIGQHASGRVSIGLPSDFAASHLPQILASFSLSHPGIRLDITSELSKTLLKDQDRWHLDVVLALIERDATNGGLRRRWRDPLVWVGAAGGAPTMRDPLPLVTHPEGCQYRARMLAGLRQLNRRTAIVFTSSSLSGLQAAVAAGLGVTALSKHTVPSELRILEDPALPDLGMIEIGLMSRARQPTHAASAVIAYLVRALDGVCMTG